MHVIRELKQVPRINNFTQTKENKASKRNKRFIYKNTMGVQRRPDQNPSCEDRFGKLGLFSHHCCVKHIKCGASRFPLWIPGPTKAFRVVRPFGNNDTTIVHRT